MLALVLILAIFGLVGCLIGGIFLYVHWGIRRKAALVGRVATSAAASVARLRPGELVEVKGTLRCQEPLTSELAGQICAYFESRVERKYEEDERDADGEWRTEQRSQTVASNVRAAPFFVEDWTGRVRVDPAGADVDAQDVFDRFEDRPSESRISLGGVLFDLGGGERTLGYRYVERILPRDAPVYVLGVVTSGGEIGRPARGQPHAGFIISHRSEEALTRSYQQDRWIQWAGLAAFGIGALILAIAVVVWLLWG